MTWYLFEKDLWKTFEIAKYLETSSIICSNFCAFCIVPWFFLFSACLFFFFCLFCLCISYLIPWYIPFGLHLTKAVLILQTLPSFLEHTILLMWAATTDYTPTYPHTIHLIPFTPLHKTSYSTSTLMWTGCLLFQVTFSSSLTTLRQSCLYHSWWKHRIFY